MDQIWGGGGEKEADFEGMGMRYLCRRGGAGGLFGGGNGENDFLVETHRWGLYLKVF